MPIYEYQASGARHCNLCQSGFERIQKISDSPVKTCPECSSPVARVISAPNVPKSSPSLDPANIEKHGFTQYKRMGKGVYEKTAGKGPDVLTDD